MKKIILVLSVLFLSISPVIGKTILIENNQISFDAPNEFEPLSEEIKNLKYPSSRAPKYVIGNKSAATTIAYD